MALSFISRRYLLPLGSIVVENTKEFQSQIKFQGKTGFLGKNLRQYQRARGVADVGLAELPPVVGLHAGCLLALGT